MIMIETLISQETNRAKVNIHYSKRLNMKDEVQIFADPLAANSYIDNKVKVIVRLAILKFARQRKHILRNLINPDWQNGQRLMFAEEIISEMGRHEFSHLVTVAASIHWLKNKIYKLEPPVNSKLRAHYDEIIVPLVEWASFYSLKARRNMKQ